MDASGVDRGAFPSQAWQAARAAFLVLDGHGRCVDLNPAAIGLLGYTLADFGERCASALLRPRQADEPDSPIGLAVAQARVTGETRAGADVLARKDGQRSSVAFIATALPAAGDILVELWDISKADPALASTSFLALEVGGIGLYELDPRSGRFAWSAAGKRQLGLPPEAKVAYEDLLASVHPDDRARFEDQHGRAIDPSSGGGFRVEYRVTGPRDKRERWLEDWGRPFFDGEGRPLQIVGATVDITEHKRAEESLRRSTSRLGDSLTALHLALQAAEAGYFNWKIATNELEWSEELRQLFGVPANEPARTETWQECVFPEDLPKVQADVDKQLEDGGGWVHEYRIRRKNDGELRWIAVRGQVSYDAQHRPSHMVGIVNDITGRKQAEADLRESEERFRAAFEQAAVGIVYATADLRLIRVNRKFADALGYRPEDLEGKLAVDLTYPEDRMRFAEEIDRVRRGELDMSAVDKRSLHRLGHLVWVHLTLSAVRDPAGNFKYFVAISEDITARKQAEQRLEDAQTKLKLALEIGQVGFWEVDLDTHRAYFSPEYKRQLGYAEDELPNDLEEWSSRLHPDDRACILERQRDVESGVNRFCEVEFRLRHKDGSYRWIASRGTLTADSAGRLVKIIGTHLDITDRKEAERRIRHAAQHDALTGLPGRELTYELAEHMLASAHRTRSNAACLFVDLDRFKPINDTHGHAVGDEVLRQIAGRLRSSVREGDLLGRVGGDEFLAILPSVANPREVAGIAYKILNSLSEPCQIRALELSVTPSIGISLYPQDAADVETLIRYADTAMFEAKERGRRNFHFFTPELDAKAMEFMAIEGALKRGFDRNEFALHYQALIDTASGAVAGVEALLRWKSAVLPDVEPDRFIPVAETTGMIMSLGDWVLREACRQHQAWRRDGLPAIPIAVNVSPVQFRQSDIRERIESALSDSGMAPGCLHLEVTESTIMKNIDNAVEVLKALKSLGLKISLDDFGTGYSSLNYLSRLPIDKLKVDKSFILHLCDDNASRAITEAIFALGQRLELQVVAEGVESEDAFEFLRARNCAQAQGFLLGRPLPPDAFAAWYRDRPMR